MHHKGLSLERWFKFSLMEQLANVGTDVARALAWRKKNDLENSRLAFERSLELLDLTIEDKKNRGRRLREILRVREAWVDFFMFNNDYGTSEEFWKNYFYNFNYAAALKKGK